MKDKLNKDQEISKLKSKAKFNKKLIIGLTSGLAAATLAAILAPTLVAVSKKSDSGGGGGGEKSQTFDVTFDANGGTIDGEPTKTMKVAKDSPLVDPSKSTTWAGHTLTGWTSNGTAWDFKTGKVTGATTLKATWIDTPVVEYKTIVFNAGDHGSFSGQPSTTAQIQSGAQFQTASYGNLTIEQGWLFVGWYVDTTEIEPDTPVTTDLSVTAKYVEASTDVSVSFYYNTNDGEVLWGSQSLTVEKNKTWADISNNAPIVKKTNYSHNGWSLTKPVSGQEPQYIEDTYKFTQNTVLYPIFSESAETRQIHYNLTGTQTIISGEETEIVNVGGGKQWRNIGKPTIQDGSKSFAGWYATYSKDPSTGEETYSDPISDTETIYGDLTNTFEVYAKFVVPDFSPTITFTENAEFSGCKILGVKEVRLPATSSGNGTEWQYVDKPVAVLPRVGDPGSFKYGYNTDHYVDYWEQETLTSTWVKIEDTTKITKNITVRPHFEAKSAVKFVGIDGTTPLTTSSVSVDPTQKWSDVRKPGLDEFTPAAGYRFVCWEVKQDASTWIPIYNDEQTIKEIFGEMEIGDTHPVRPHVSNTVYEIDFQPNGVDTSGAQLTGITYIGVAAAAVEQTTGPHNPPQWQDFNKPVATHNDGTHNYSFVKWQWYDVSEPVEANRWKDTYQDTPITGNIIVRPVMEKKITITYNVKDPGQPEGTELEIETTISTPFKYMYAPNVTILAQKPKVFSHWALVEGSETAISGEATFSGDTTIYAVFRDSALSTQMNYMLLDADMTAGAQIIANPDVTLVYPNDAASKPKFSAIGKATGEKLGYLETNKYIKGQVNASGQVEPMYSDPEKTQPIYWDNDEDLEPGVYYAFIEFEMDQSWRKVEIPDSKATTEHPYSILRNKTTYYHTDETPYFPASTFPGKVRSNTPGWKQTSWKDQNGATVDDQYEMTADIELNPVFTEAKANVTFEADKYPTATGPWGLKQIPYSTKLFDYLKNEDGTWKFAAALADHTFKGWQIKKGAGSTAVYESITEDTYAEDDDITIVPKFIGKSEFEYGDKPYFIDSKTEQWAQIISSSDPTNLTITYAGTGGIKTTIPKQGFNEEIYFGTNCKTIEPYFLSGCSSWNNGYVEGGEPKPLTMPNGANKISIGESFLYGCTSFNQKLEFESNVTYIDCGENFMRQCESFNQDINFAPSNGAGTIKIRDGFMFDCTSFTSTITIPYSFDPTDSIYGEQSKYPLMLATSNKYAPTFVKGFTVKASTAGGHTPETIWGLFQQRFGSEGEQLTGPTYRKVIKG